jgi:transposase
MSERGDGRARAARDLRAMRRVAIRRFEEGAAAAVVARELGVARSTAWEWQRRWKAQGALEDVARGPRPRLSQAAAERLARALLRPPRAEGFHLDRWSLAAVVRWIEREEGIRYHPRHVSRVLARAGFLIPPVGAHGQPALLGRSVLDRDGNRILVLTRG